MFQIKLNVLIFFFLLTGLGCFAQEIPEESEISKSDDDLNAEQIIEKYKPALVSIWMNDKNYFSYISYTYIDTTILNGSGFILNEDGLIGTNFHVIEQIDSLIVKTDDGKFYTADLIMSDEANDFAIIKINSADGKKFQYINLGNSDEVKAGQDVFAIGSPLGYEYTISSGIVAAVRENEKVNFAGPDSFEPKEKIFEKVIQITAAISPGNSGGALFNTKGDVIGITTYTYIGFGNLNFAVAINGFKKFLDVVESTDFENNEELKNKKDENLFSANYRIASGLKSQLVYDWYYSKVRDTMSKTDSFIVRQDSINKRNLSKSEQYFQKCIALKPDTFIVYQELLDLYVLTDNYLKAENLYKDIREKFDSDSLLNLLSSNLASAYSSSKDYYKAIQFYQKMLEQDSTQYFIRYQIANLYSEAGDYKKSVDEYKSLLKYDPGYSDANVQLGKIYFEKYKNIATAKKYLQKAYEDGLKTDGGPGSSDLHYYLGLIAVKEGRKLDAILSFMDLKNSYDGLNLNEKKMKLYKAIRKMEE